MDTLEIDILRNTAIRWHIQPSIERLSSLSHLLGNPDNPLVWLLLPMLPARCLEHVRSVLSATLPRSSVSSATCCFLHLLKVKLQCVDACGSTLRPTHHPSILLGHAWFSVQSLATSSASLKSCGHSPSSSNRSLFFQNYSYPKGQKRWKPSRPSFPPLLVGIGLSVFRTGDIGTPAIVIEGLY